MRIKHKIYFEPMGCSGKFPENSTILDCARHLEIGLISVCGGTGTCGKCLIKVQNGAVSPVTDSEKEHISQGNFAEGYRLACRTQILGDCRVFLPQASLSTLQRAQVEGMEITTKPEPAVLSYRVTLSPPSLNDLQADLERIKATLVIKYRIAGVTAGLETLRQLYTGLRQNQWSIRAVLRDNELIGLLPVKSRPLGLAVDLGTTKIAAYLIDISSGKTLGVKGTMNPQTAFGGDIISRMVAAIQSPDNAAKLQETAVEAINSLSGEMCKETGTLPDSITDFVIVGNTAMHHLLLRLPVKQLCSAPYNPVISSSLDIRAHEIGLNSAPGAYIHLLPNIAGYVGADHVAVILASGLYKNDKTVLALDIGTNTEICLAAHHTLTSLSCASGPAFEGAHIKHGMRVAQGAIEHLRITDGTIEYQTVGDTPAVGICGSGIIDVMAQLLLNGIIDASGKMHKTPGTREADGTKEFVIASGNDKRPDVTFSQKDVREIQLAKGAIRTGINVLLEANGIEKGDIAKVIVAGAFGTYTDISSAITIGMLPDLPLTRYQQVGNAAGMGAKMALISRSKRLEAQEIAGKVKYIELASYPSFQKIFAKATNLGQ